VGRSNAYWATNLYLEPTEEPGPTAPLRDLPPATAARFRTLRAGLLAIPGATEEVRFMGAAWRWAWEYGIGHRKLCWLHLMRQGPSATFTVSVAEEGRLCAGPRLPAALARAVQEGQRTGPVKWCWLDLGDRHAVRAFLALARRKAQWLTEEAIPRRPARRGRAAPAEPPVFGREESQAD
jgi:hypothetical protein